MAKPDEFDVATARAIARRAEEPGATAARYDRQRGRIVVCLNNGLELSFSASIAQGLENAKTGDLTDIEIIPSGFGIHFPRLDAHLHLPALLRGVFGSKSWMAVQLGTSGGAARSPAKTAAARTNGKRGGRPRKVTAR